MKATLENVETIKGDDAFVVYALDVPYFEFKWHYHPEYELTLITNGHGRRIVGDSHQSFASGDLVLLGPELPHTWSSEPAAKGSAAVVIQFTSEFINRFASLYECRALPRLLENSSRGSCFRSPNPEICAKIQRLPLVSGLARITGLLEILLALSDSESESLSSATYSGSKSSTNASRINKVCRYVSEHAAEPISLEQAASLVSLSKSAFCKFFARNMKTSFSDYVNEIRIANACLLLADTDKTVSQVASDCGFESLTYFNRVFRRKKATTPLKFRMSA